MFPQRPLSEWEQYLVFGPAEEAAPVDEDVLYDGQVAKRAVEYLDGFGEEKGGASFFGGGVYSSRIRLTLRRRNILIFMSGRRSSLRSTRSGREGHPRWRSMVREKSGGILISRKKGGFSEANQRETKHAYYACISYIDAQIGRVMEALEKSPYADNTIVVLWSDHGYHLGE